MKRLAWLLGLVACHATRPPETLVEGPPPASVGAAPRPDPATCLVARSSFANETPWVVGCPPVPEPLPADARPCAMRGPTWTYTYEYDSDGRVVRIRSESMRDETFEWADGRLTAIGTAIGVFQVRSDSQWTRFVLTEPFGRRFGVVDGRLATYASDVGSSSVEFAFTETAELRVAVPVAGGTPYLPRMRASFADGHLQAVYIDDHPTVWTYEGGRPMRIGEGDRAQEILYSCAETP